MPSLMPLPARQRRQQGSLLIDGGLAVHARFGEDPRLTPAIRHLVDRIRREIGIALPWMPAESAEAADLVVATSDASSDPGFEDESHTLSIGTERVLLRSASVLGALRGLATLTQLAEPAGSGIRVPLGEIDDGPRFIWRGLVIDSVRRWLPPEVIVRNLEAVAAVKLNVLHWHLTDDQGFRVESLRYPLLHGLGSGGSFYSQDEVREIVGFATDLGIRVVPEFDMPGHATSWFVGYPELASAPGPFQLADSYGGQTATMDPSRSEVYAFIGGFLEDMTSLFPDPFVHIGGDEVDPTDWRRSRSVGAFMRSEGIGDFRALQAYFNRRLHDILSGLDRHLVGWDPVLHESLPPHSVVETARSQQWLVESAQRGHRVIAGSEYYLTGMHSAGYHYRRDPFDVDEGALTADERDAVLGGEASMWTEVAGPDNIDSRIWPRTAAIAERLWSPQHVCDVDDMYDRLLDVSRRLDQLGLTHLSGPWKIREQLVAPEHHDDLHALSELLQPVPSSERRTSRNYTTSTVLNRLVDATAPDSWGVRRFERLVTHLQADPADPSIRSELTATLSGWKALGDRLQPVLATDDTLAEAEPLAAALSAAAEMGLAALESDDIPGAGAADEAQVGASSVVVTRRLGHVVLGPSTQTVAANPVSS